MVHFDATRQSQRRLRLAVDLAARFHAALIGVADRSYLPPFLADDGADKMSRRNAEASKMSAISPSSPGSADDRVGGAGGSMYRFLECTAGQYMTRAVTTVRGEVDMRELRHCSNSTTSIRFRSWRMIRCWGS
jgi:hypothetical protein